VRASSEAAEAVEFALDELGTLGTHYSILARPDVGSVLISAYFENRLLTDVIREAIGNALEVFGLDSDAVESVSWQTVEDRDWMAEWKKHWKPTITGEFVVAPPWDESAYEGKIIIRIEPGMAFGTGTHETTRLCLGAIEKLFRPGMSFLDVGTGTGILAIAAAKIAGDNPACIEACDTDAEAVAIAVENAEINGVSTIEFHPGSLSEAADEFDFICANLTTDVILELLPALVGKSRRFLVLSGILAEHLESVITALEGLGVRDCATETDGEWSAVTVRL